MEWSFFMGSQYESAAPNLPGGKVVLPAGMLVQLVLPCAYYRGFDHIKGKGDALDET